MSCLGKHKHLTIGHKLNQKWGYVQYVQEKEHANNCNVHVCCMRHTSKIIPNFFNSNKNIWLQNQKLAHATNMLENYIYARGFWICGMLSLSEKYNMCKRQTPKQLQYACIPDSPHKNHEIIEK